MIKIQQKIYGKARELSAYFEKSVNAPSRALFVILKAKKKTEELDSQHRTIKKQNKHLSLPAHGS